MVLLSAEVLEDPAAVMTTRYTNDNQTGHQGQVTARTPVLKTTVQGSGDTRVPMTVRLPVRASPADKTLNARYRYPSWRFSTLHSIPWQWDASTIP